MLDFALARRMMVDCQLRTFDVNNIALLAAMEEIPREQFVPEDRKYLAYSDGGLLLTDEGEPRSMLAPMVLARLVQGLDVKQGERVLDVACGFGYGVAVLSRLGARVIGLESSDSVADQARRRLASAGAQGVEVVVGPLDAGHLGGAPYDAMLINGAIDSRPQRLLDQLSPAGRLACIEGRGRAARAILYVRSGDAVGARTLFDAAAQPLAAFRLEPVFQF